MAGIIEQNTQIHIEETSARSLSMALGRDVSVPEVSGDIVPLLFKNEDPAPAHLKDPTDRARGDVEAASSANTRKAYASDWKHFSAWCQRSGLAPLPSSTTVP